VQLAVAKKAEDGQGLIVRLVETKSGKGKTQAEVELFQPITKAVKTNLLEEHEADVSTQNGKMSVPVDPSGIETFRVVF